MRTAPLLALLLVTCGPDDGGRGTATASTSAANASGTTAASTDATTDATTTSTTTSTSTPASTGDDTGDTTGESTSTTTAIGTSTSTTGPAASTGDGGSSGDPGPSCPPEGEMDCSPGPGSGEGDTCVDTEPCFRATVQAAIKQVLAEHPEWFMHDDMGDFVLEVELYMNTVVELVSATGLCAIRDPNAGDEIAVKHDNEYAENFDILTAAGYARYGDGIYTSTCIPAWF